MRKTASSIIISLMMLSGVIFSLDEMNQINLKLRVTASLANIRNGPSLKNRVIMRVEERTVLNAVSKIGNWYCVILSQEGIQPALHGYIHQSIVEVISETKPLPGPPEVKPKKEVIREEAHLDTPPETKSPEKQTPRPQLEENIYAKRMYIRANYNIGFQEQSSSYSWQETLYHEESHAAIDYDIKKGSFFSASFGFHVYEAVFLELGIDVTSRNIDGAYSAAIPHPLLFDFPRSGDGVESYKLNETSVFFNLVYSIKSGRFGLDFSAGPAYIQSKSKVISGIHYQDSYPYDSVTLNAEVIEASKNVFGFNAGANILFHLTENLALDLNARYVYGKADLETGTAVPSLQITVGGFRAGGGLKILF